MDISRDQLSDINSTPKADLLEIIFYTDPLCCWSWGFEPQWRRLRYEFEGQLTWRYCMGGMLASWKNFHDELNSVSRPAQMGPVWMHASQITHMPMNTRIWMEDAPASSYPACIAFKAVELQSLQFADTYLRLLREAIMLDGKNIANQNVLIEIAEQLKATYTLFDVGQFQKDLTNDNGLEAFRKDLQQVQYRNINRFPTLIIRYKSANPIMITGYRPYPVLMDAINQIAPNLQATHQHYSKEDYLNYWKQLTEQELKEIEK